MKRKYWNYLFLAVVLLLVFYLSIYRESFTGKNPLPSDFDLEEFAARPFRKRDSNLMVKVKPLTPTVQKILDYAKTLNYDKEFIGPGMKENPEEQIYYFLIPSNAELFKEIKELVYNYKTKPYYDTFVDDISPIIHKYMPGLNEKYFLESAKSPKTGAIGREISDMVHAAYDYIFEEGFSVESSFRPPPSFDYTSPNKSGTKCTPHYSQIPGGTDEVKCFS